MVVGISVFELHLPEARSLKQKRKVVRGLVDRLHSRLRISVAETDHHDLHQRTEIAVAAVALDLAEGRRLMDKVREIVDEEPAAFLTQWDPQILEGME